MTEGYPPPIPDAEWLTDLYEDGIAPIPPLLPVGEEAEARHSSSDLASHRATAVAVVPLASESAVRLEVTAAGGTARHFELTVEQAVALSEDLVDAARLIVPGFGNAG